MSVNERRLLGCQKKNVRAAAESFIESVDAGLNEFCL